jgi:prepilin-type N-terminal cleavage/methylation domain-containing protein
MSLDNSHEAAMKKCGVRSGEWGVRNPMSTAGFTLIELLVAMTITLLIAGALAAVAQPARTAFERVPAELELHQRGRAAIDALSHALRASISLPGDAGTFSELSVVMPVVGAAQGLLSADQPGPGAAMPLAIEQCPDIKDICGFTSGAAALITDSERHHDVFSIASVNVGARSITPAGPLSRSYADGARVSEIDQFTFRLAEQPDGSHSLIRETLSGAIQPIVDGVSELSFDVAGREVDAGFVQPEQIDVLIVVEALTESLRSVMTGRVFRTSIRLRNAS